MNERDLQPILAAQIASNSLFGQVSDHASLASNPFIVIGFLPFLLLIGGLEESVRLATLKLNVLTISLLRFSSCSLRKAHKGRPEA